MEILRLKLRINTLEPLLIAKQSGDTNLTGTFLYIPATVIRGMFANEYIKKKNLTTPHENMDFCNLFLNGAVTFTNLYLTHDNREFFPCPLSLHTKKGEDNHKIYNLIKDTKEETKPLGGFVSIDDNGFEKRPPETIMYFHHTRDNRIKGCSTEGKIFYYEAIKEGQEFIGYIAGKDKYIKKFFETFRNYDALNKMRLGRSHNTQYGLVNISIGDIEEYKTNEEVDRDFDLTFISPVILYNGNGYPEPSVKNLKTYISKMLGCDGTDIEIDEIYSQTAYVEHFISVWKLKTPRELALAEGSAFSIKIPESSMENLKMLQIEGIGEKTHLGYGRVKINWITKTDYTKKAESPKRVDKPSGQMPQLALQIFKEITKNKLLQVITASAISDVKSFQKRPSNSLLGKLELMLKTAENIGIFRQHLNKLRKPARDKLENCKKDRISLFDHLKKVYDVKREDKDIVEKLMLQSDVNFNDLKEDIYRTYWLTVFRFMRMEE